MKSRCFRYHRSHQARCCQSTQQLLKARPRARFPRPLSGDEQPFDFLPEQAELYDHESEVMISNTGGARSVVWCPWCKILMQKFARIRNQSGNITELLRNYYGTITPPLQGRSVTHPRFFVILRYGKNLTKFLRILYEGTTNLIRILNKGLHLHPLLEYD